MPNTVRVDIKWNDLALTQMNRKTIDGLFRMGMAIANQAKHNAPYVTGALRNTIRVQEVNQNTLEIRAGGVWAGKEVDYAWIREQGPNRNPATEHYMENAMNFIMTGNYMQKYFGDIV